MSIFSRFRAAVEARANRVVDHFEDPKASLDYSLARLEESRGMITRSLVEVSAARTRLQYQYNQVASDIKKYAAQSMEAVRIDRDDLARIALERKQAAELRQSSLDANIASLGQQEDTLKQSQINLEHRIALFRSKKEELKAIYDSSRVQLQVREAIAGISEDLADVGSTVQRIEIRIQEMQSRSDAIDGLVAQGVLTDPLEPGVDEVDRELGRIGRQHAIEDELARLKSGEEHYQLPAEGSEKEE